MEPQLHSRRLGKQDASPTSALQLPESQRQPQSPNRADLQVNAVAWFRTSFSTASA